VVRWEGHRWDQMRGVLSGPTVVVDGHTDPPSLKRADPRPTEQRRARGIQSGTRTRGTVLTVTSGRAAPRNHRTAGTPA
jgi:hypothetical protein